MVQLRKGVVIENNTNEKEAGEGAREIRLAETEHKHESWYLQGVCTVLQAYLLCCVSQVNRLCR